MGSKGSKGQSTSTYSPSPVIQQAGQTALGMATQAAQTPFQTPAQPVAPFSQDQLNAFQGVQNLQGYSQPYINQAASYLNQSAQPLTAQQIGNYYNPYAANVFANMADTFGQQNSQYTGALTNTAGGVGADRIGVAQANLAKQQGLAAGQTAANLYQSALGAAQQQQALQQAAGYGLAQVGTAGQNSQLQALSALLGTGGQQQQQQQSVLNSPYQQQLAALAYPFQTAQYLAGITSSLTPTQQSTQTTTPAQPSLLSQILGGGLALTGIGSNLGLGKGSTSASTPFLGASPFASVGQTISPYALKRGGSVKKFDDGGTADPSSLFLPDTNNVAPDVPLFDFSGAQRSAAFPMVPSGDNVASLPSDAEPTANLPYQMAQSPGYGGSGIGMNMADSGQQSFNLPYPQMPQDHSFARSPGMALLAAGLGIMGGTSPFAGVNIGQGGLKGLAALDQQRKSEMEEQNVNMRAMQLQRLAEQQQRKNFTQVGHDALGRPVYGWVDPIHQTVSPATPSGTSAGAIATPEQAQAQAGLTGNDFLNTLPGGQNGAAASLVKKIANYEINPVQATSMRGGDRRQMMEWVSQYDPTYNQALYGGKQAMLKEFLAGGSQSPASQITAGNTAIQHFGEMSDSLERLKAMPGMLQEANNAGIPFVSYWAGRLQNAKVHGTPEGQALDAFTTARDHAAEEVTKFYSGTQGSEAERDRVLQRIDAAKSLPELRQILHTEANLMQEKVNALQSRYQTGMSPGLWATASKHLNDQTGDSGQKFPLIHQQAQDAIKRIDQRYRQTSNEKKSTPLPDDLRQQAQQAMKTKGRDAVIRLLQEKGYNTEGL